jgi:hypothetical protein
VLRTGRTTLFAALLVTKENLPVLREVPGSRDMARGAAARKTRQIRIPPLKPSISNSLVTGHLYLLCGRKSGCGEIIVWALLQTWLSRAPLPYLCLVAQQAGQLAPTAVVVCAREHVLATVGTRPFLAPQTGALHPAGHCHSCFEKKID